MEIFLKNRPLLILLSFIILASVVANSLWGIPVFIAIILCHYIVPGIALQKLSGYLSYNDFNKLIFSSYASGYALSLVIYALLLLLGLHNIVMYISVGVFIISLIYLRRDLSIISRLKAENTGFITIILFMCLGISFIGFQLNYLSSSILRYQNYYQDLIFWYRNAVAATKAYPLPDLSVMGNNIFYHYFSSLGIADIHFISGVDLYNLCFTYSYLINVPLVVGSVYLICSEYVKTRINLFVTCLFILFGTTLASITYTNNLGDLYFYSFGYAEGFALSLCSFYFYKRTPEIRAKNLGFLLLLFVVAVGAKAPVALIVLVGILCDNILFMKEKCKVRVVTICSAYMLAFLLSMVLFVININPQLVGYTSLTPSIFTVVYPSFFNSVYLYLRSIIPFAPISLMIVFVLYILINSYGFVAGTIILWRRRKLVCWRNTDLSLPVMFVSGYILFLFLSHTGFSNAYFYFAAIPFGTLYIMSIVDNYIPNFVRWEKLVVTAVFIVGVFCLSYSLFEQFTKTYSVISGNSERKVTGNSLTTKELEALLWARDNIDKSAILISNKYVAENGYRSYILSAFTEHQTYMEGYLYSGSIKNKVIEYRNDLLLKFFANDTCAQERLKKEGVTHVVLFKNIPNAMPNIKGDLIFDNNSVAIYALS